MNKDLISVIVPVYNVQKYLDRCIESIINQTYKNLEIILVDDGSPDNSPSMCDEWAKKDVRIKVIHKENGGLSSARNAGLDICKGKYIAFVDSDDILHTEFIETHYNTLSKTNADLSVCQFKTFINENELEFIKNMDSPNIELLSQDELIIQLFLKNNVHYITACTKLYKKRLFQNISFPIGKIHEDEFIVYKIFDQCQKAVFINLPLYFYRERTGSITKTFSFTEKNLDSFYAIESCYDFYRSTKYEEMALNRLINSIASIYITAKIRKADKSILEFLLFKYKYYYKINKHKSIKQIIFYSFPNLASRIKSKGRKL